MSSAAVKKGASGGGAEAAAAMAAQVADVDRVLCLVDGFTRAMNSQYRSQEALLHDSTRA